MEKRIDIFGRSHIRHPAPSVLPVTTVQSMPIHGMIGPVLEQPTFSQMASNFVEAIAAWAKAGFSIVSSETAATRRATCEACPLWDDKARLGLGKCNSPKCGCSRIKVFLATEKCPEGKW